MLTPREKDYIVEAVMEAVSDCEPEDVLPQEALEAWALDNGFVKGEDKPEDKGE